MCRGGVLVQGLPPTYVSSRLCYFPNSYIFTAFIGKHLVESEYSITMTFSSMNHRVCPAGVNVCPSLNVTTKWFFPFISLVGLRPIFAHFELTVQGASKVEKFTSPDDSFDGMFTTGGT